MPALMNNPGKYYHNNLIWFQNHFHTFFFLMPENRQECSISKSGKRINRSVAIINDQKLSKHMPMKEYTIIVFQLKFVYIIILRIVMYCWIIETYKYYISYMNYVLTNPWKFNSLSIWRMKNLKKISKKSEFYNLFDRIWKNKLKRLWRANNQLLHGNF